jgi:hypothetical protein
VRWEPTDIQPDAGVVPRGSITAEAGARVRVVAADGLVHIYWGEEHIRTLTLDPNSRYQGASVR